MNTLTDDEQAIQYVYDILKEIDTLQPFIPTFDEMWAGGDGIRVNLATGETKYINVGDEHSLCMNGQYFRTSGEKDFDLCSMMYEQIKSRGNLIKD